MAEQGVEKDAKAKKTGIIRRKFNAIAKGIYDSVPKTPWQVTKKALSASRAYFILPFSLKGVFLAVAFSQVVPPLTAPLFPSAEDYLKDKGFDPEIVNQLAPDEDIRIRSRNLPGKIHAMIDAPLFLGAPQLQLMSDVTAYAIKNPLFDQCRVMLPNENITAKQVISTFARIPPQLIENVPISDKEAFYTIAFHELRHCSDKNRTEPGINLIEGNADLEAIDIAAETFNNPELKKTFMYLRALSFEPTHDGTLYLDANINDTDLIFKELGASANEEVRIYMEKYYEGPLDKGVALPIIGGGGYVNLNIFRAYLALETALENHRDDMSSNAVRRAELFMEAVEYFSPSYAGTVPKLFVPQNQHGPVEIDPHKMPRPPLSS